MAQEEAAMEAGEVVVEDMVVVEEVEAGGPAHRCAGLSAPGVRRSTGGAS